MDRKDFRKRSKYRIYAENIGLNRDEWEGMMKKYSPNWEVIPPEIKTKIKAEEKKYRESCDSRLVPPKHKYCYILGRSKRETKHLHELFKINNPKKVGLSYPKKRGK